MNLTFKLSQQKVAWVFAIDKPASHTHTCTLCAHATLSQTNQVGELDYHVHDKFLYHLGKLCIPQGERFNIIREAHSSLVAGHFGVGKIVANLQGY